MRTDDRDSTEGNLALVEEMASGTESGREGSAGESPEEGRGDEPEREGERESGTRDAEAAAPPGADSAGGVGMDPAAEADEGAIDAEEILRAVTALIFASPEPLTERKLASLCGGEGAPPGLPRIRAALESLRGRLQASGLPIELRSIAGGWRLLTTPETAPVVQRLFESRKAERISPAALETLAIVAYRQPVTKAEIEAIRGVQAGPILRSLVDRDLIKVCGRADVPGHPLQYATTKTFLDRFGLSGLDDLPRDSELTR